jgi:hypothetical protein
MTLRICATGSFASRPAAETSAGAGWRLPMRPRPGRSERLKTGSSVARWLTTYALPVAGLAATAATAAAPSRVQAGVLEVPRGCDDELHRGFVTSIDPACSHRPQRHSPVMSWMGGVRADPSDRRSRGPLRGVTAGAAVGRGGNANALVGGANNSFALQPLTFGRPGLSGFSHPNNDPPLPRHSGPSFDVFGVVSLVTNQRDGACHFCSTAFRTTISLK